MRKDDDSPHYVATPNQILYGIDYVDDVKYSLDSVKTYLKERGMFVEYSVRDKYTMIYQITSSEKEEKVKKILGVGELPEADYSKEYLLLSVGRKIYDLKDGTNEYDRDNHLVVDIIYTDEPYADNTVFVYKMNRKTFSSGDLLEYYFWENVDSRSNLVYDDSFEREILSEGEYHTLYRRNDGKYVYRLYGSNSDEVKKRAVSDVPVTIEEYSETIIEINYGKKTTFYNPQKNSLSEEYTVPMGYVAYNIVWYMRINDGRIQLVLRDAYDKLLYAKIIDMENEKIGVTKDKDNIYSLVENVEYNDNTSVWVEYHKGESKELVRKMIEVYGMKR